MYAVRAETAELQDPFVIEIPIRFRRRWGTREAGSERVPGFRPRSAVVFEGFSVPTQVVAIERHSAPPRTRRVHSPARGLRIGDIIKEAPFIQIPPSGQHADAPL